RRFYPLGKITPIGTNTQKKGLEKTLISKPFLHSHTAYLGCLLSTALCCRGFTWQASQIRRISYSVK
ncbi:MAG: hypothetical protein KA288_09745, partial [Paludibacteraceae bacterium]|nr:hypothetical protein [Paludibacteraceae bacterium]